MPKQLVLIILLVLSLAACTNQPKQAQRALPQSTVTPADAACINPEVVTFLGVEVDGLCVKEKQFGRKDNLQRVFKNLKLDKYQYEQFLQETKEYIDFTSTKTRQKYFTITNETDSGSILHYFIVKVSDHEYIIANCTDTTMVPFVKVVDDGATKKKKSKKVKQKAPPMYRPLQISLYEKNIDTTVVAFAAVIDKSVYKSFKEKKMDARIIEQLNKVFNGAYTLNKMYKGDTLQFIYHQLSINGQFLSHGHVEAVVVKTKKRRWYAIDYFSEQDSSYQYLDDKGKYIKTAFLKSPLQKGGRIASRYNLKRLHPVLQVEKAHLGTDFAAPHGTPIVATASGIVTAAQFTQNNGNYVKIRHDKQYETQYLHMSRFAKGIRSGVRVQQGQVIGYVGSTGLSTGPHVCYRFWKRGVQVDPLKEKLNTVQQIGQSNLEQFRKHLQSIQQQLDRIPLV